MPSSCNYCCRLALQPQLCHQPTTLARRKPNRTGAAADRLCQEETSRAAPRMPVYTVSTWCQCQGWSFNVLPSVSPHVRPPQLLHNTAHRLTAQLVALRVDDAAWHRYASSPTKPNRLRKRFALPAALGLSRPCMYHGQSRGNTRNARSWAGRCRCPACLSRPQRRRAA